MKNIFRRTSLVLIAAMGNEFRQDDGVAKAVVSEISDLNYDNLMVLNDGNNGISLIDFLDTSGVPGLVVLVDAADFCAKPGEVKIFDLKDARKGGFSSVSTHTYDIFRLLEMYPQATVKIVGIQPKVTGWGIGLSKEVLISIPAAVKKIDRLVREWMKNA